MMGIALKTPDLPSLIVTAFIGVSIYGITAALIVGGIATVNIGVAIATGVVGGSLANAYGVSVKDSGWRGAVLSAWFTPWTNGTCQALNVVEQLTRKSMETVKTKDADACGVCWSELLYAPGIEELMHGELGAPRAMRIPESALDDMAAEARITGAAVSDVARNRIATALLDAQEPTTATRSRQLVARFLRQAMLRAVNMTDAHLAIHLKEIAAIPGVSFAERRVFEIEARRRQTEAELQ